MKIMLVDDSRSMRNIQKRVLSDLGYADIVEATDGRDALSQVFTAKPDLILLDWSMPKLDGLGFLKKFRARNNSTIVIMVTTQADKSRVLEALKAGVNNYVVKPFTPDHLAEKIQQTLVKACAAAAN